MERTSTPTKDGSATLFAPQFNQHYHSTHGAAQESRHVFLKMGLEVCPAEPVHILEMGLGTGLNALLTLGSTVLERRVIYTALEAYPLVQEEWEPLDYQKLPELAPFPNAFQYLHHSPWEQPVQLADHFVLIKHKTELQHWKAYGEYHLIYFDAFSPDAQPELWTAEQFAILYNCLLSGGILVTYSAKGSVKRALQSVGFEVEKVAGPPGKREMLRAWKR